MTTKYKSIRTKTPFESVRPKNTLGSVNLTNSTLEYCRNWILEHQKKSKMHDLILVFLTVASAITLGLAAATFIKVFVL
jgi:hypothetical protein